MYNCYTPIKHPVNEGIFVTAVSTIPLPKVRICFQNEIYRSSKEIEVKILNVLVIFVGPPYIYVFDIYIYIYMWLCDYIVCRQFPDRLFSCASRILVRRSYAYIYICYFSDPYINIIIFSCLNNSKFYHINRYKPRHLRRVQRFLTILCPSVCPLEPWPTSAILISHAFS